MEQATQNKKDFFELLENVVKQQSISVPNTNGQNYNFQALTAQQLRDLIQTLIDNSLTNLSFNSAVLKIMKQNFLQEKDISIETFNILDKILFILSTRINTISSKVYILNEENEPIEVDLNSIQNNVLNLISNTELALQALIEDKEISIKVGLPNAKTDLEINEKVYKNLNLASETAEQVENTIGKAFVAEIIKWVKTITIKEKTLNYSELTIEEKIKFFESLPASIVEKVLTFVENTKQNIQNCLIVSNKVLPLDGSLFSIR